MPISHVMQIAEIRLGSRYRQTVGDLTSLVQSIERVGLLHPVVVTSNGELIAGARRLAACLQLGWQSIPVHVIDLDNVFQGEQDENVCRKDFTPSEAVAIADALRQREQQAAKARQGTRTDLKPPGKLPGGSLGQSRDKLAAAVGLSGRTLEKATAVVRAAQAHPQFYASIAAAMDKTGNVDQAYKQVQAVQQKATQAQSRAATVAYHRPDGHFFTELGALVSAVAAGDLPPFQCIYADPPWQYGNQGTRASTSKHYATMTLDALEALPIEKLAAPQCHLHLWTTNGFLFECPRLFAAWGFTYKSSFVWAKPQIGIGNYWRNAHEFLLLGVRGGLTAQDHTLRSWQEIPREGHSAKPDRVRDLVEKLSPGPYLELFGRKVVRGWTVWGNERLLSQERLFTT